MFYKYRNKIYNNIYIYCIIKDGINFYKWRSVVMDKQKIKQAVIMFLEGIGEDVNREGLIDTPDRISRMCEGIFAGFYEKTTDNLSRSFYSDYTGMVLEKNITFYSMCEHHLLPFFGKAHVAYIPNGKVVGLSKIARIVELYSKKLQMQENMGMQIAKFLMEKLDAKGAMVMLEAEHTCMTMRGVKKPGTKTVTLVKQGVFETDSNLQHEFYNLIDRDC